MYVSTPFVIDRVLSYNKRVDDNHQYRFKRLQWNGAYPVCFILKLFVNFPGYFCLLQSFVRFRILDNVY